MYRKQVEKRYTERVQKIWQAHHADHKSFDKIVHMLDLTGTNIFLYVVQSRQMLRWKYKIFLVNEVVITKATVCLFEIAMTAGSVSLDCA